jgi:hypothetical protein
MEVSVRTAPYPYTVGRLDTIYFRLLVIVADLVALEGWQGAGREL